MASDRAAALRRYQILDTPPEEAFDELVRLAARVCAAPAAALAFFDQDRTWCKAVHGAADLPFPATPLLEARGPVAATGEPSRALAPLITPEGVTIGGLVAVDPTPRAWDDAALRDLGSLARIAMDRLESRRIIDTLAQGKAAMERLMAEGAERAGWGRTELVESVIEQISDGVLVVDTAGGRLVRNTAAIKLVGVSSPDAGPREWATRFGFYLPDQTTPVPPEENPLALVMRGEEPRDVQLFLRNPAVPEGRWVSVSAAPLRGPSGEIRGGIFTVRDVTERKTSERLLREDESRFRAMAQSSFEGLVISADERILEVNEAFTRMTGYTAAELAGKGPESLVSPDYLNLVRKLVQAESPKAYDVFLVRKDGTMFPAEVQGRSIDFRGRRTRVTSIRDIGPRRDAERAIRSGLQRALAQQEALLALTRSPVVRGTDLDAALRDIIRSSARTLGVERVSAWVFSDDRSAIRCLQLYDAGVGATSSGALIARTSNPAYFRALEESDVVAADDAEVDPRTSAFTESYLRPHGISSMLDAPIVEEGTLRGVLCHEHVGPSRRWTQDERTFALATASLISRALGDARRREAEGAMRESEGRLQHFLENAHDMVVILDPEGRYDYVNRAWRETLGYTLEEARKLTWEDITVSDQIEGIRRLWVRILAGEDVGMIEITVKSKDGRPIDAEGRVDCLRIDGKPVSVRGIFLDVTDRKKAEEALRRSEDHVVRLEEQAGARTSLERLVGKSAPMREVYQRLRLAAQSDVTVLLTGESGTGKELAAGAIHSLGTRRGKRFLAVNCSAIPDALLESELFGHVKGAFTGAVRDKVGLFQAAEGGTLFLDEVGDMSPSLQVKVLRALQEREVRRVGDERSVKVDVRLIAATNRDLPALVAEQKMREDFYYRIRVFEIHMPSLRSRREDIPLLLESFTREFSQSLGKPVRGVDADALRRLMEHGWPGNVRELRNAVEHAFVTLQSDRLTTADLPPELRGAAVAAAALPERASLGEDDRRERDRIVDELKKTGGNRTKAAKRLGISRVTLWNRMIRYGIDA